MLSIWSMENSLILLQVCVVGTFHAYVRFCTGMCTKTSLRWYSVWCGGYFRSFLPFWWPWNRVPSTQVLQRELQAPGKALTLVTAHHHWRVCWWLYFHVGAYWTCSWASLWRSEWQTWGSLRLLLWHPALRIPSVFTADGPCSWTGRYTRKLMLMPYTTLHLNLRCSLP